MQFSLAAEYFFLKICCENVIFSLNEATVKISI